MSELTPHHLEQRCRKLTILLVSVIHKLDNLLPPALLVLKFVRALRPKSFFFRARNVSA